MFASFLLHHLLLSRVVLRGVGVCIFYFCFSDLNKNTDSGFSAGLVDDNNPFEWQVILSGPPETI